MDVTEKTCPTCHRPLPADAPLCPVCALLGAREEAAPAGILPLEEIQAAFPELEILECIGRGGMGIVYKARQPHLDRLVALKILAPELSSDPGFAERFSREALTLAKLSHPHIVGIHDYGRRGDFCFLIMEYVDGVNLRQAMRAARFTPEQALSLIPDLCSALQFAHDQGILHRDIKPENILIDTRGRVRIADFGIAQLLSEGPSHLTLTATGSALGSAAYMAPEQIEASGEIDHRADIYSLGVVFYEMLTGGLPLGRFPLPSEKCSASTGIDDVVLRALEKERERRYQSADAVRSGLSDASFRTAANPQPRKADPESLQRRLTAWSLGLLGGGLITGAVGYLTSPVILGLGAVAFIFGVIGCWWLLIGMKTGRYRPEHRKLLLAVAFVPVLLGMLWLIAITPLLRGFTDVIYSRQPLPLLWIIIPFAASVVIGKFLWKVVALPAPGPSSPRFRRFQTWAPVAGTLVLLLSLLAAKHLSVHLNLLNKYYGQTFQIREARTYRLLNDEDAALVKAAALKAAGEHAGFYRVEFPPFFQSNDPKYSAYPAGGMGIDLVTDVPWSEERAKAHVASFEQRMRALLPRRIAIDGPGRGIHDREVEFAQRMTRGVFGIALVVSLAGASLLIIFTPKEACIASLATGLIATVALSAVSGWPTPSMLPPSLGDRQPLPALPPPEKDFSTFESTVDSVLRAAVRKDTKVFLEAFNTDSLNADQVAALPRLMPLFAASKDGKGATYDKTYSWASVKVAFQLKDAPPRANKEREFAIPLTSHPEGWRIDGEELPGLIDQLLGWAAEGNFEAH